MRIIQCDRCDRRSYSHDKDKVQEVGVTMHFGDYGGRLTILKRMDLCPSCIAHVETAIKESIQR
jgi:hypothetical protein